MDWFRGIRFQLVVGNHHSLVRSFVERFGGRVAGEISPTRVLSTQTLVQDVANGVLTAELDGLLFVTTVGFAQTMRLWHLSQGAQRIRQGLMDIEYLWGPADVELALAEMGVRRPFTLLEGLTTSGLCREILKNLDGIQRVEYLKIAVERTGIFSGLQAGLESRGCQVREIPVHGPVVGISTQVLETPSQDLAVPLYFFVFNDAELYDLQCWRNEDLWEDCRVCVLAENETVERNALQLGFEVVARFEYKRLVRHDSSLAQELAARFW